MSGLLYGVGALVVLAGAVMIGFGIPVNEFSFGNTLIGAGATAVVGGLIIAALGAAVAQLQRIAEIMAARAPLRAGRPMDMFDPAAASRGLAAGRPPFPPRPKLDRGMREPAPPPPAVAAVDDMPMDEPKAPAFVPPMLRNPDAPPAVTVADEASLSPQPTSFAARDLDEPMPPAAEPEDKLAPVEREPIEPEPPFDAGWRLPPEEPPAKREPNYFDAMWPADEKPSRLRPAFDSPPPELPEPEREPEPEPAVEAAAPELPEPEPPEPEPVESAMTEPEQRGVAILKSGVVDGMAYTLYVDGSIEAELPQGTLHFASINELRSHLERNS